MKRAALIAAIVGLTFAVHAEACGVERWAVKTLTDPAARQVRFRQPVHATVATLTSLGTPTSLPATRLPEERLVFRVRARVDAFKLEDDGDIHLVISDPAHPGVTMIAEFPSLACTRGAQHRWWMELARRRLELQLGRATRRWRSVSGSATLTGVLFFDFQHGQRGVAANAVELHPVLGFRWSA